MKSLLAFFGEALLNWDQTGKNICKNFSFHLSVSAMFWIVTSLCMQCCLLAEVLYLEYV